MRNAYRNLLGDLLESDRLEDREEYGKMTLILLKRNIVRLGFGYSWLRIGAPTDIMVLNLQVWLPEGVVCCMTDRKEAVSVELRVCVCVCCLN
jgi:hypothetical protein